MGFVHTEVAVDSEDAGVFVRLSDDRHYPLAGGSIRNETEPQRDADGITVNSGVYKQGAPDTHLGEEVTIRLSYNGEILTFPAAVERGTASNPDVFRAERGEHPAVDFEKFEQVKQLLEQAEADGK